MSDLANRFKQYAPIMPGCTCKSCLMFNEILAALSPPEPTEGKIEASALADRIERWMNDAAMYAEGQIFDLCPEDQPTVIAALRAMPLQQGTKS